MELKEALEKVTPQEYQSLLSRIEVQDTYLKRLECFSVSRNVSGQSPVNFKEDISTLSVVEDCASVEAKYSLQIKEGESDAFMLNATYVLTYKVQGELPEAFYVIFKTYTAPLQSFPYVRELVHSMTSRMGIPTLVLPLRKILVRRTQEQQSQSSPQPQKT